ncbi:Ulp1 protease family, catalytic domain protein, partial [Opisthorchis viverrini]
MKWVILVLGQHMTNSPSDNVSVQQMELFASTIRENDGFCKMDCSLLEARKLLLDCGLRLPRAEARMQRNTCAAGNISREQLYSDTPPQSTIGDVLTQVTSSQSQSTSNLPSRTEGGLLTNVLNTLSSTGMYLLGQPSCPSNNVADGLQSTQNAVDEDNDDLIILSEESADCSRTSSPPILSSAAGPKPNSSTAPQTQSFKFDYKPPGSTDSVTLTQADFDCLAPGGLLNDAIINFYLKYLYFEQLTDVQRQATYLFNCFFYSRLAGVSPTPVVNNCRPPTANPPTANVTTGQNNASGFVGHIPESSKARHANVAKWTRRVDLFCKDYIIIPINEASHWFLGLVCYPWMAGMVSYTALYRAAAFDLCQLTNEFLDVDLIKFPNDVDDKTISQEPIERRSDDPKGVAFDRWRRRRLAWLRSRGINAMPCILLFDSLPCQTRVSNLHVIRDYLQVEWDSRRSEQDGPLHFDKDTIRGFSPRVPSQSNLVDCGIYLLHYVEMFFKQPVQSYTKDYFQNEMSSWFSDDTVGQKRADIRTLLARLNERYHAEERTD